MAYGRQILTKQKTKMTRKEMQSPHLFLSLLQYTHPPLTDPQSSGSMKMDISTRNTKLQPVRPKNRKRKGALKENLLTNTIRKIINQIIG